MVACRMLTALFDYLRKSPRAGTDQDAASQDATAHRVLVCRTHDEVNAALARAWCDENGMEFQLAGERDPLFPAGARALVIDVNHLGLDAGKRAQFLERLPRGLAPCPVAVASYDLSPDLRAVLLARGWLVFRHIKRTLFYELANAIDFDIADIAASRGRRRRQRQRLATSSARGTAL